MSSITRRAALIRLIWLAGFAIAMALVEAAIVIYLRAVYYADNPLKIFPLQLLSDEHLLLEFAREAATIVMLIVAAALAAASWPRRLAAFAFLFGLWDLAYYGWLKIFLGWPMSWVEWDLLFLIPWPWLGPWIAPALIALLWTAWGGHALAAQHDPHLDRWSIVLFCVGALLALAAFLAPAWPQILQGREAAAGYMPGSFAWGIYATGVLAMAVGLGRSSTHAQC